jgi:hypothetical protein
MKAPAMLSPQHGKESAMFFSGIVNPKQLAILTRALDDYCEANRIAANSPDRSDAGKMIMTLYEQGWRTRDELRAMLETRESHYNY